MIETWKVAACCVQRAIADRSTRAFHEVSDAGRIRSRYRHDNVHYLDPFINEDGYRRLNLHGHSTLLHVLVMETFIGPKPAGLDTRHRNGHPYDNRISNLAYGTRTENMADARAHGTLMMGENHVSAKLTADEALAIFLSTDGGRELAARYEISEQVVCDVRKGRSWRSVTMAAAQPRVEVAA